MKAIVKKYTGTKEKPLRNLTRKKNNIQTKPSVPKKLAKETNIFSSIVYPPTHCRYDHIVQTRAASVGSRKKWFCYSNKIRANK